MLFLAYGMFQTQYKYKNVFFLIQRLADRFNVVIVRIFGAVGHGKGLRDAMSSFGVKSILRRGIVTLDKWFSDTKRICECLTFRGDHRMPYVNLLVENLDQKRSAKGEIPINGCMAGHLFAYRPNKDIVMLEYLCDCEECLCLNSSLAVRIHQNSTKIRTITLMILKIVC